MTSNKEELWKDVVGYEGYYMVSNYGNVKSGFKVKYGNRDEWVLLKVKIDRNGYENLTLCKNGNRKMFKVHRLVTTAFLGESNLQVNHKNGIRNDNRLDNLEWVTASENIRYSFEHLGKTNNWQGRKHKDESKEKIRQARLGKSSKGSNHIYITINGIEYKGIRPACKELGLNRSVLRDRLNKNIYSFDYKGKTYVINSIKRSQTILIGSTLEISTSGSGEHLE